MGNTPGTSDVYYKDRYWNDHPLVLDYMSRNASGPFAARSWWPCYFRDNYLTSGPLESVLILNCGNGWVERDLYDSGVIRNAVAFDYSADLLEQARNAAGHRPFTYFRADCNKVDFAENSFDAVFNVAAMHHVLMIDRMNRLIARALKEQGYFVNFDYIGPQRNQYTAEHFGLMQQVNAMLPERFRSKLPYPDLKTMLHFDPTEAVHSELIIEMFERYFYTVERKALNGGIAYQIMHNNPPLFEEDGKPWVKFLIDMDEACSHLGYVPPLFAFYVGKPRKELLKDAALMDQYTRDEEARESA